MISDSEGNSGGNESPKALSRESDETGGSGGPVNSEGDWLMDQPRMAADLASGGRDGAGTAE